MIYMFFLLTIVPLEKVRFMPKRYFSGQAESNGISRGRNIIPVSLAAASDFPYGLRPVAGESAVC